MTRRDRPLSARQRQLLLELLRAELRAAADRPEPPSASPDDVDDGIDDPGQSDGG
ncbi:hypothetical protein [Kutzneria sp. NPDC052558]|uniref:hypothetical protein n=1 Tax=Kutzneria sp. NPDC052558 TaxID=3364121 RepID=UPI0037C573CD